MLKELACVYWLLTVDQLLCSKDTISSYPYNNPVGWALSFPVLDEKTET